MPTLSEHQAQARKLRIASTDVEERLYGLQNQIDAQRRRLQIVLRQGDAGADEAGRLQSEITRLSEQALSLSGLLNKAKSDVLGELAAFALEISPESAVTQLDDRTPYLLLPVRIETRFSPRSEPGGPRELWIRVFPDDIAIHTHEKALSPEEVDAGRRYWRELWQAAQNPDTQKEEEKKAWRKIADLFDGRRAAWVVQETKPATLDVDSPDDLVFPEVDPDSLKPESWSRAPRSNVMPDRFAFIGYRRGEEVFKEFGSPIPDPLILGPDPRKLEDEIVQEGDDIKTGTDLDWIYDFDRAEELGMGIKIPLSEPAASQGLDRILVLGLKLSTGREETTDLVEKLLENHHYSVDGLSLLPQGAPTNNTDRRGSVFSSIDLDREDSFANEAGDPNFDIENDRFKKKDGQRLAEVLGIDTAPLEFLEGAGNCDVSEAIAMNRALWPASLGYFFEEFIGISPPTLELTYRFFRDYVVGRGIAPAIRVGRQPYGILPASALSRWTWSREEADRIELAFLDNLTASIAKGADIWKLLSEQVRHARFGGDSFENLLDMMGLHASSVEFHRRVGQHMNVLWNHAIFLYDSEVVTSIFDDYNRRIAELDETLDELFALLENEPEIRKLVFNVSQDAIPDPLVDDVEEKDEERFLEDRFLPQKYRIPVEEGNPVPANYIEWLLQSKLIDLKGHAFIGEEGPLPMPKPLLYRLLHRAYMQAHYNASFNVYTDLEIAPLEVKREMDFNNVQASQTVSRWEFMEAPVSQVAPQLSDSNLSMADFLSTADDVPLKYTQPLNEVKAGLELLAGLSTASLERLFAEHLDICSYRLDAWQTGLINRRLDRLRYPIASEGQFDNREKGIYLGAFGWVEDLRPDEALIEVDLDEIPEELLAGDTSTVYEQPGSGGFIHGASINHAAAAAVLRNAYLTHASQENVDLMTVNLSSERVRIAFSYLEGLRHGQELGALLGYQFERGLHERKSDMEKYILAFRQKFPLVADKITPNEGEEPIDTREALMLLDGYALLEATVMDENATYPFGVKGIPADPGHLDAIVILEEIGRMAASMDAIADLALAEGVYQVTQGNYDRAGAIMRAISKGNPPPEAEIVHTPRSGLAFTQRVSLHFDMEPIPDIEDLTPRAKAEPELNRWVSDRIGSLDQIKYLVTHTIPVEPTDPSQRLSDLGIEPLDLVYMIGDTLEQEATELENRIAYRYRKQKIVEGVGDIHDLKLLFMERGADWETDDKTVFEVLPLLRELRTLITGCRPLHNGDYQRDEKVEVEEPDPNPERYDKDELQSRLDDGKGELERLRNDIIGLIPALLSEQDTGIEVLGAATDADFNALQDILLQIENFGFPDAIPLAVDVSDDASREILALQAVQIRDQVVARIDQAGELIAPLVTNPDDLTISQQVELIREAARLIWGSSFNLLPRFSLSNREGLQAAVDFRDDPEGLTRNTDNPFLLVEWMQGLSRVREKIASVEQIDTFVQAFNEPELTLKPLQLPFNAEDPWVAVEFPPGYQPEGSFLSIVQWLPSESFVIEEGANYKGLLIDQWTEVIPNKIETTGLAIHYDQPGTEPPQALLLAVTPEITGSWSWTDLVDTLHETLDRARLRGVEPVHIGSTPLGQVLPALITSVTSYPFGTISTDLVYQTAVSAIQSVSPESGGPDS